MRRSWLVWLVIAFGALLAISSAQDIDSVAETARWPTIPGTVVASSIVSEEIVVHYDPRDPATSVLDSSAPIGRWVQLVCALLLMAGVWMATRPRRLAI